MQTTLIVNIRLNTGADILHYQSYLSAHKPILTTPHLVLHTKPVMCMCAVVSISSIS